MTAFCIWQYTDHVKFGNIQCFQHTDRARFGKIMTMQRECLSIVDLCGHCERGEGRGSWKGVVLHVSSLNKDKKDHVHGSVADSLVAGHTFKSDVVLGQTSQSVSYRPRYDACRNIGVGLKMVTTLTLVVYTCIMGIEPPTKS